MKSFIVLLVCIGIGYIAEVYFENPQKYTVWTVFSFITFSAYLYLTKITSLAFSAPITTALVGVSSFFSYIKEESAFVLFGIYGAMGLLILFGDKFLYWKWSDWKYPAKFMGTLTTPSRKK
jgi:hypothetical protein